MLKNFLRLLTALISFIVLLIVPNTANAATHANTTLIKTENQPALQQVNLNIVSPSLQLASKSNNSLLHSLGCSCPTCTQGVNQTHSNI